MHRADEYATRCEQVFGSPPPGPKKWIHFPYDWPSPEARELLGAIWAIENRVWRSYIKALVDENISGCIVEFGVSEGWGLAAIINFRNETGFNARVFGFDSFEGLPKPEPLEPWKEGEFAADFETTQKKINPDNDPSIVLFKGWFRDTLTDTKIGHQVGDVAFARVDCDLYTSTVECLSFLETRLVDGAFLIFDDWTDENMLGETKAFFEFAERTKGTLSFEMLARIALGGMHMRVRRRPNER